TGRGSDRDANPDCHRRSLPVIVGIGTDLVLLSRIEAVLERQGERFARRILTPAELQRFLAHSQPARYLAKRYAAKEAILKALGRLQQGGGGRMLLSLSDERVQALAFALWSTD